MYTAVADGMATNLVTSIVGFLADVMVELVALKNQAVVGWVVGVGLKQFRTT